MNQKKAKLLRKEARAATVGKPDKLYWPVVCATKDDKKKGRRFRGELWPGESTRYAYKQLKRAAQ